jgi:serine/threonine protein kinase
MEPDRFQLIGKLYHEALRLEPNQRADFLEQSCSGDEGLRQEVESLLNSEERVLQFEATLGLKTAAEIFTDYRVELLAGDRIGHYEILSPLGSGGMGQVYLALDTRLGRRVALKLLPREYTRDPDRVSRFDQEARAVSALNHPNIITIFEVGEVEGVHFIATEFVDGPTLRQQMTGAQMSMGEMLDIAIQVAIALSQAHEAGIVHRDIKPENIMRRRDGYIKVLDFGLAKLIEPVSSGKASEENSEARTKVLITTDPGHVVGTPRYMSPEQIRGQVIDYRSDIFSLGVVLYEMIAGHPPFDGATPGEVCAAILNHSPPPLARYCSEVPSELERIVGKSLARNRELRYQSMKDLLIDLRSLKQEMEFAERLGRSGSSGFVDSARQPQSSNDPVPVSTPLPSGNLQDERESLGGAVPLGSRFYIMRPADEELRSAIARQESIVLIKGARQVGKTSLLARGLQQAREAGAKVALTDFQDLSAAYLESIDKLLLTIAESLADQLGLNLLPHRTWNPVFSPGINFERYLRREVFTQIASPVVWALDEADRLFTCDFGSEVFGLFRSLHNKRALDPAAPWRRLTIIIAYATEAHLFITDLNQSPFNVGTRLTLEDFTREQVEELNRRYGSPLRDAKEVERFFRLVGGHPYLVRRGLYEMSVRSIALADLEAGADRDEGPFGDHLRRLLASLAQDQELCEVVRGVLEHKPCPTLESFYRLRSAGLMKGDSAKDVHPRCQLYATYLEKHLS